MFKRMGFVCLFIAAIARAQVHEGPSDPANPITAVDCLAGESIQAAVNADKGPVKITIRGTCVENVVVRNKDISLVGIARIGGGIRSSVAATPALIVMGPVVTTLAGMTFSDSAGLAVSIRGANVTISGCRFENNGGTALQVNAGGFVTADALTFNANVGRSMNVSDAQLFCTGCDVSGNNFAVLATRGAVVSLLDSVVTGRRGIFAVDAGTIADLDCATAGSGHPCVMKSSGVAAQANGGATVALVGTGDFAGQIGADDRGTLQLFGSRQVAGATPGEGPDRNLADHFGTIVAAALDGPDGLVESQLLGASAEHFSRVLVTDATTVQGAIQCGSAADAWLDRTVILTFGSTVAGCDHAAGR